MKLFRKFLKLSDKFLYVFSGRQRQLLVLLIIFLISSLLEAFGIGMIGAFLNLASAPEKIKKTSIINEIYHYLNPGSDGEFIALLGIFIVGIFIAKSIAFFLGKAYTFKTLMNQRATIQERLFDVYLLAPYEFHLGRNTSDFINKISSETFRFTNLFAVPFVELFSHGIVILSLVILMTVTDKILLVFSLIILAPAILIVALLSKRLRAWGKKSSLSKQKTIKTINHGLGGLKETRIIGCEEHFRQELKKSVSDQAHVETLFRSSQFLPRALIEALLVVVVVGFVCFSQLFLQEDFQSAVSTMGVFALASFRLVPSASQLSNCLSKLRNSSYTLDILHLDLKEAGSVNLSSEPYNKNKKYNIVQKKTLDFSETIDLKEVFYRYPTAQTSSLNGISMSIRRGSSIGIIGKSGAGKTTLVDVLLALLMPESGDILVDGRSIYENLQGWKQLIGYIPQSIYLLDDTVENNIAYGVSSEHIDKSRLSYAIHAAQLDGLIQDLENGVKTRIGERGVRLSGGQRQRIGIARALYHQREILVLDEATSALDSETEKLISDSIQALSGSKTLIIIAHRLTTIEHCDFICVLEKGRVVRAGNYQEVVLESGKYNSGILT